MKTEKGHNSKKLEPNFISQQLYLSPLFQIVDKTILFHDKDNTGKINFEEFCEVDFFGCTNLKIFTGGWKHGYSHEDGCGSVSWHLRVRGQMQNEAKLCAKMETAALNVLSTSNNEKKMEGYPFPHETQFKDLHNMTICT